MQSSQSALAEEHGYRILKGSDEKSLILIDLQTRGPALFTWISGGLAVLLGVLAVSQLAIYLEGKTPLPLASPLIAAVLAVGAAVLCWRGFRTYFRRRGSAGKQLVLTHGRLEDEHGQRLAAAGEVTVRTAIDWTDGTGGLRLARLVKLCWPSGQATIYKTFDKNQLATVRAALAQAVVG